MAWFLIGFLRFVVIVACVAEFAWVGWQLRHLVLDWIWSRLSLDGNDLE